jgi:hypothetical protein
MGPMSDETGRDGMTRAELADVIGCQTPSQEERISEAEGWRSQMQQVLDAIDDAGFALKMGDDNKLHLVKKDA